MDYWDFFTDIWTSPLIANIGILLLAMLILIGGIFAIVAGFGAISADELPLSLRLIVAIAFWAIGIMIFLFGIPFVNFLMESVPGGF